MKTKVMTVILTILFTLCIFNYSQAASNIGGWGQQGKDEYDYRLEQIKQEFERKNGYSMDFCNSQAKRLEEIHLTLYNNPDKWIEAKIPNTINGWSYGWQIGGNTDRIDGICGSLVWARGAACVRT